MHVKKFSPSRHNGWHMYRNLRWHWKPWFPGEVFTIHFMKTHLKKIKSRICFQVLDYTMWNLRSRGGGSRPSTKSRRTRPLNHLIQGPCFQLLAVRAACGSWKTKHLRFAVGCVGESCGMDGWIECFFLFIFPREKGHWGFFFKHFVFKLEMDGWFFGSKNMNNLGRFWLVAWDFSHLPGPLEGCRTDGKGCHSKHHHWRVLVRIFSLLFNFSGVVLKTFREASLILGGEEDPKNHSTASNHSNSWLIQVREISPLRSHMYWRWFLLP